MDIHQMLDLAEELLNLYGYSCQRNVGVVGGEVTTADLSREGIPNLPLKEHTHEGIVHKIDLLGEKNDIERPFGRIAVHYKRGNGLVTPGDIAHLKSLMDASDAYFGMYLTVSGVTPEADNASKNNRIEVITPEKLEKLIGKMQIEEPWWNEAIAFKPKVDAAEAVYWFRWYIENHFHFNWDAMLLQQLELAYIPYWKVTYYVAKTKARRLMKMPEKAGKYMGFIGINAFTGKMDFELHASPDDIKRVSGAEKVISMEALQRHVYDFRTEMVKIEKPKLPKNAYFNVYKPAIEKHEAKLSAQQHLAHWLDVEPEDIIVVGRELIYIPFWRARFFNRPIVKNVHVDTEWFDLWNTAVFTNAYNYYEWYPVFRRDWFYPYIERVLLGLMGPKRYTAFMRNATHTVVKFYWDFNLMIPQSVLSGTAALIFLTVAYLNYLASGRELLSGALGTAFWSIVLLPLFSFLYLIRDYVGRWPYARYPQPHITPHQHEAEAEEPEAIRVSRAAYEKMLKLEKEGKLTAEGKKRLEELRHKYADALFKRLNV